MLSIVSLGCSAAILIAIKILWPFFHVFYTYTFGKMQSKRGLIKKAGDWAIITGSTDGIGKAYAKELAKEGLNIMLISRNITKLNAVAEELKSAYHVETKVVVCDFTQGDIYENLSRVINSLGSIACLVNNVGMSYPKFNRFVDADFMNLDFIQHLLNCNVNSVASMTRIVLPLMLSQNQPGCAIINVSSFAGLHPFPYLSLYGASKAFVRHLTNALSCELEDSNITFQTVCPMLVATEMSKIKRTSFFVPSPEKYAKSALNMFGVEAVTMGYFSHALQAAFLSIHPKFVNWVAQSSYQKTQKKR